MKIVVNSITNLKYSVLKAPSHLRRKIFSLLSENLYTEITVISIKYSMIHLESTMHAIYQSKAEVVKKIFQYGHNHQFFVCEKVILKNIKNYEIKRDEVLPRDEVLRVAGISKLDYF